MGMADFNGKVESIQEAPFGYTMSVIGGKWKKGYYLPFRVECSKKGF